jgi:hypothetical protein
MAIAAASGNISSSFVISSAWVAEQGTVTITNPGRSFRIVQVYGTGLNGGIITTRQNTGAGATVGVCTLATGDLSAFPSVMTAANIDFSDTDNIHITVGTANCTGVDILCVATGGGQALTTAVT